MESEPDTTRRVKATLGAYTKSREQVAYIRRILALYIQHRGVDNLPSLSLFSASDGIQPPPKGISDRGVFDDYFRAVENNLKARQQYVKAGQRPAQPLTTAPQNAGSPLEQHLAQAKLQKKAEKLQILQKYLDRVADDPLASQSSTLEDIFRDGPVLPDVPKEVLNSFSESAAAEGSNLPAVLDQMERVVLRTKLQLRREEQLLADVRLRAEQASRQFPDHARLHALNETRNELINWIETELGNAAGADDDDEVAEPRKASHESDADVAQHLDEIRAKYSQYVQERKSLLEMVSSQPQPTFTPGLPSPSAPQDSKEETPEPTAHLAIPYVERLLELSREQKGMIQHKSHLNASYSNQVRETKQMLKYLAEESQLLPSHPMPGAKKGHFSEEVPSGAAAEKSDTTKSVRPWVYAADSAKIATLEAVAEKVEEGQLALEGSMKALHEIDQLLGRKAEGVKAESDAHQEEEDIWLSGEPSTKGNPRPPTHTRKQSKQMPSDDPWSALNGSLGLIRGDSPRK